MKKYTKDWIKDDSRFPKTFKVYDYKVDMCGMRIDEEPYTSWEFVAEDRDAERRFYESFDNGEQSDISRIN
jgi:hypothetical protein